jgi:PPOX class probable F420-dependent enzyme
VAFCAVAVLACLVDLDKARAVVAEQNRAVLATVRGDGTPQMSPVIATLDDGGKITISTRQTAYKLRNIRRNPRVWLCVLPDDFYGEWLQVEGITEVLELPDAMEPLVGHYRRAMGEQPDWDEFRNTMVQERRVILRIEPTRAGPDQAG